MINLMIGSNFDLRLPSEFAELNAKYSGIQINEVYGSIPELKIFGSARPDFRLPKVGLKEFEMTVEDYVRNGIKVNYTENSPIVNKANIDIQELKNKLRYLEDIGVTRITLAHPLAIELVSMYSKLEIEISTIYAVANPYQLRELKKRAPSINKVCIDVDLNRSFQAIRELMKEGVEVELLANEFCIFDCIDRVQCYNDHTQISTEAEAAQFKRYPMGRCISSRQDPIEWMRARFILPQSLSFYESTLGVTHFKITGRTHPTAYILWIAEEYMKQAYSGNLLQLWADVKNIKRVSKGQDFLVPNLFIEAEQFGNDFLWKYWMDSKINFDRDYETEFLKQYEHRRAD